MSIEHGDATTQEEQLENQLSRNPEDYWKSKHAIQSGKRRGEGKDSYPDIDGDVSAYGIQQWHYRYLVRNGEVEWEGWDDRGNYVARFVGEIPTDKGDLTWILPAVMKPEGEKNFFKTCPYPKGPSDEQIRKMMTFKP